MVDALAVTRPSLAFRVGVTGARDLSSEKLGSLRPAVTDFLALVARELTKLAEDPRARVAYDISPSGSGAQVELRLVSPLAEGADRLVACEALEAGFAIYAPLPFPQAEYEKDFPGSIEAFHALLARAEMLELDGARGLEAESYREVGRFVVRNCDLLIAIWDGERERGVGGTGEIVQFAANARMPVWWIDATGKKPARLIDEAMHLLDPNSAPMGADATAGVTRYLARTILPPTLPEPERNGILGFIALRIGRLLAHDGAPLNGYLAEKPLSAKFFWGAYAHLMHWLGSNLDIETPCLAPPASRAQEWWREHYETADRYSSGYGDRYRSSYVLIAAFAFIALAASALGAAVPRDWQVYIAGLEILALGGIATLVIVNHLYRWHERWISYRLLAELCRKQYVLSSIGRSLPGTEVVRLSLDAMEQHNDSALPREAWVAWYFAAALRAAPFPAGDLSLAKPYALDIARSLIVEQTAYHRGRKHRNQEASRRIEQLGEFFFLLTILAGGMKASTLFFGDLQALTGPGAAAGAVVSAASGAFVGVRAYSEFSLLVRQSTHMLRVMKEADAEFAAISIDRPLASRELGRKMYALALLMMNDVRGWAQLFGIKTLEPG